MRTVIKERIWQWNLDFLKLLVSFFFYPLCRYIVKDKQNQGFILKSEYLMKVIMLEYNDWTVKLKYMRNN